MDLKQKTYNQVLLETSDFFKAQGISIIGEGFKEIATNPALFESYVEALTEGVSADHSAVIGQLMANTNAGILRESSLSGIAPIASLSMPVIRKLWPKYALKEVFKTEVAKTPRFVVSYMRPYMYKGTGDRIYLPRGLYQAGSDINAAGRKDYIEAFVVLLNGGALSIDFGAASDTYSAGAATTGFELTPNSGLNVTGSATTRQPLDSEFRLVSATLRATVTDETVAKYVKVPLAINRRLEVNNTIIFDATFPATTFAIGAAAFTAAGDASDPLAAAFTTTAVTGQIIVRANLTTGVVSAAAVGFGLRVELNLKAAVSSEFNESGYSIGFDIARLDIDIPTGQHINAPLPIEALNDMMALYQIDGTKETVDLMTNVFATKLDVEALEFLQDSFDNQPGVAEFSDFPRASAYSLVFDVRPAAGFAGSPKAWREELKPQIDFLAQKIKNQTYLQAGIFTLVGNPLDVQLITNVDWQFRGGQGANMDGVDVDYSIGTYVGANAYRVISSVNVPSGEIFLVFTPSSDTQMTYKYYPYTFSTEMGYIDPNRSRVPSIMMTKRHTFAEFLPAIGSIQIVNNDGNGQFSAGYWPITGNWGSTFND
jgi:hypothetical protein